MNLRQRIRDRRKQKLRMRLFIHFGNSLQEKDLRKMASIYQLMLKLPSRHWNGIIDMIEKTNIKLHVYEPGKTIPEAFEWVKTGVLPAGFSSFRKENPNGASCKPNHHRGQD